MPNQSIFYFIDDFLKNSPEKLIHLNLDISKNKVNNKLFGTLGSQLLKFKKLEKLEINLS